MTEEQAISQLETLKTTDPVSAHREADAIVLLYLEANGHGRLAQAYKDLAKAHGHGAAPPAGQ